MAIDVEIKCINKTDRYDPHDRIKNVGGINGAGERWTRTQPEAIAGIENGTWTFYVRQGGTVARVVVATRLGHKYLKTVADGEHPNNLLSLPECP